MKFAEVQRIVGGVPFISPEHAMSLYNKILCERPAEILELGIAHGTATCVMAAALDEIGAGTITAVDLADAAFAPSAEEQLARCGLTWWADVLRMQTGYTWFLHDEIRRRTANGVCEPKYDLCIIDGPKNWTIDGCAFFLADKLLRPGGWIVFDDYDWTYAGADATRAATDGITHRALSEAERTTPQIREVFELLVVQHGDYGEFVIEDHKDWAMARKTGSREKSYTVRYRAEYADLVSWAMAAARKTAHKLRFGSRAAAHP
ncbi:MAG TPA: class I SAM-dependent methyltransferase [Acidobacteriaceae bacterium]|nr:class I SAM-dependent methyltransferase [Acidobacteriaceae bacterium]